MKTTFTLLLCCFGAALAAQSFTIHGVVTHAQTKQPLEHVNIYAPQNDAGAVSRSQGYFSLKLEKLPDTLVISCVGYATLKWPLAAAPGVALSLALEPKADLIPEVSIVASKKAEVIYPPQYSVMDYDLYDGLPVLLVCKNSLSGYWLVAMDENDRITGELKIKGFTPETLAKSCLGGIYLLSLRNAYGVAVQDGAPVLTETVTRQRYEELVVPCVGMNEQYIYFSRWYQRNQVLSYQAAPRNGGPHIPIRTVGNEAQVKRVGEEAWFRSVQLWMAEAIHGKSLQPYQMENLLNNLVQDENIFAERFVYTPLQVNLFAREERLCLFNHTNDYLEWMKADGESLRQVPIQYHNDKHWKSEILCDEATGRFYTLMEHGDHTLVLEINTYDGTTSEYLLLDQPFVQNVKVFNGKLYFLYKDFAFSDRNFRLHRVG